MILNVIYVVFWEYNFFVRNYVYVVVSIDGFIIN